MPFTFYLVYIFAGSKVIVVSMVAFVLVRFNIGFVVVSCVEYTALFAGFYTFYDKTLTTNGQVS